MFSPVQLMLGALLAASTVAGQATEATLPTDRTDAAYGHWNQFDVSDIDSATFGLEWIDNADTDSPGFGSPLTFSFTIGAGSIGTLTVVDAGFAGDTFQVSDNGSVIGVTSPVQNTEFFDIGVDFDAATAQSNFSRASFRFGAGEHSIGGVLAQSFLLDGEALNSTIGAVRLTVSPIPEPATAALLLAGLGMLGAAACRR